MDAGDLLEPEWAGGTIMNCGYRARIKATVDDVWQPVSRIGGKTGWYFGTSNALPIFAQRIVRDIVLVCPVSLPPVDILRHAQSHCQIH